MTWQVAVRCDSNAPYGRLMGNSGYSTEAGAVRYAKCLTEKFADKVPSYVEEITVLSAPYGTWWSEWEKWTFVSRHYSRDGLGKHEPNPKDAKRAVKALAAKLRLSPQELAEFITKNM